MATRRQFLQQRLSRLPVQAGVGNALPVDERQAGADILAAGDEEALEHHAANLGHARRDLPGYVTKDVGLPAGVLVAVGVTAIDHQTRAQARGTNGGGLKAFKSVYSIFISRVDVYTEKRIPDLSPAAQGLVGIVNAKRCWRKNMAFWKDKNLPLQQEMIFASTGTKKPADAPDKYIEALAGSDIQTNPPATNEAVEESLKTYTRHIDQMPSPSIVSEIDRTVDMVALERDLLEEGVNKFVEPQMAMLRLIAEKRASTSRR